MVRMLAIKSFGISALQGRSKTESEMCVLSPNHTGKHAPIRKEVIESENRGDFPIVHSANTDCQYKEKHNPPHVN